VHVYVCLQCFDLETYLRLNAERGLWTCPICEYVFFFALLLHYLLYMIKYIDR